ncbi:uncharacterized protein LOC104453696 isoform X2 [Eucalyptus grandis]|uniref:uncharacterized protein LOC104453696 isoform X2 n=1 Tax=Eucalyptus grandis TaxID=71139 RepID=UPI00192EDD70|nr:uncharacterized protein LOC104453696 isoform X2 [Eucalyptus grandis]
MGDYIELSEKLNCPADGVFEFYRGRCYRFPTIMPTVFKEVKLINGEWDAEGSERNWTFVNASCGSWMDTVGPIDTENKSIKWTLLAGDVPLKSYKSLSVVHHFSISEGGCVAKVVLTFEKKHDHGPVPIDYMKVLVTCSAQSRVRSK